MEEQAGSIWLIVSAVATAAIALAAFWLTWHARKNLAWPEQIANVPRLVIDGYLDRELADELLLDMDVAFQDEPLRKAVEEKFSTRIIRAPANSSDTTGRTDPVLRVRRLKEARELAKLAIKVRGEDAFLAATTKQGTWENRVAYELTLILNRLGNLTLAGAVPFSIVVSLLGRQIVEDFYLAHRSVRDTIRRDTGGLESRAEILGARVPDARRHAEWLASACAVHLLMYWVARGEDPLNPKNPVVHMLAMSFGAADMSSIRLVERRIRVHERRSGLVPGATDVRIARMLRYAEPELWEDSVLAKWDDSL